LVQIIQGSDVSVVIDFSKEPSVLNWAPWENSNVHKRLGKQSRWERIHYHWYKHICTDIQYISSLSVCVQQAKWSEIHVQDCKWSWGGFIHGAVLQVFPGYLTWENITSKASSSSYCCSTRQQLPPRKYFYWVEEELYIDSTTPQFCLEIWLAPQHSWLVLGRMARLYKCILIWLIWNRSQCYRTLPIPSLALSPSP